MTDEEMRVKIAEACGFRFVPDKGTDHGWMKDHRFYFLSDLPDYLNDLNAMHEAEKTLFLRRMVDGPKPYYESLCAIVERDNGQSYPIPLAHHATARQRAEAFIKTTAAAREGQVSGS